MNDTSPEMLQSQIRDLRAFVEAEIERLERHLNERFERAERTDEKIRAELRGDIRQITNELNDLERRHP